MSNHRRRRKARKMSQRKREFLERAGYCNQHHNLSRCRGGNKSSQNLILFDERRHAAFHLLCGNRTLREAAELFIRLDNMRKKYYGM